MLLKRLPLIWLHQVSPKHLNLIAVSITVMVILMLHLEGMALKFFKLDSANSIVNVANSKGISTSNVYANDIRKRPLATDTVDYGAPSDGVSPQVEYMRYDHANSVLNIVSGIAFSGRLNSDRVSTANNTTMSVQRNSVDYIRLTTDDRTKLGKQTDINNDGVGLTISDSADRMIQLGSGNQTDLLFVGGGAREMYLELVILPVI